MVVGGGTMDSYGAVVQRIVGGQRRSSAPVQQQTDGGLSCGLPGTLQHGDIHHIVADVVVQQRVEGTEFVEIADFTAGCTAVGYAVHPLVDEKDVAAPAPGQIFGIQVDFPELSFGVDGGKFHRQADRNIKLELGAETIAEQCAVESVGQPTVKTVWRPILA